MRHVYRLLSVALMLCGSLVAASAMANPEYTMAPRSGLNRTYGFSEGLARVYASLWDEGLQGRGFVDTQGRYVVKPEYDKASDFHDARAAVARYKQGHPGENWGYIDRDGRDVLDVAPDWHGVDPHNPNIHNPVGDFHDGWLRIVDGRDGNNFVDRNGQKLRAEPYPAAEPFSDGLAVVSIRATPVEGPKGDNELSRIHDSLPGPTPKTYKWAVIDARGRVQFEIPDDMERVGPFIAGRAPVYREGKWGLLDDHGKVVVPARYEHKPRGYGDRVTLFAVAGDRSDNRDGYVETFDRDGNRIARIPFTDAQGRFMVDAKQEFHEGLLGVELARGLNEGQDFESLGWGFIDAQGRVVVEPQFYSVGSFGDGHAFVSPKDSGTTGIMRNPLDKEQLNDKQQKDDS